jgi:hypothetical protein
MRVLHKTGKPGPTRVVNSWHTLLRTTRPRAHHHIEVAHVAADSVSGSRDQGSDAVRTLPGGPFAMGCAGQACRFASRRTRFTDATCNVMLRRFVAADPTLADTPQATIRPRYWTLDPQKADIAWKRGVKVLMNERLEAARMASPVWAAAVERITGIPHPGLKTLGRLSREMLTEVSHSLDERRRRNIEGYNKGNISARVWKPSKPVIHLCLGMRRVIEETAPDHQTFYPWAFFGVPKLTYSVIERASHVFALADQVFDGIHPDQMIEVIAA